MNSSPAECLTALEAQLQHSLAEAEKLNATVGTASEVSVLEFWKKYEDAIKSFSHECTKFSLMFEKPPIPEHEAAAALCNRIQQATSALLAIFACFPVQFAGQSAWKRLHDNLLDILRNTIELIAVVKGSIANLDGNATKEQHGGFLQRCGALWQYCDAVPQLPKNSVEAFERNCEEAIALLEDACSELRQEIADMTSDYESDHDAEQRARLTVMLIRLGKQIVEKTRDSMQRFKIENPIFSQNLALISDADSFCSFIAKISPTADDLAVACYASKVDEDAAELFANAESMANLINTIIDRFSESQIYLAHEDLQQLNQIRTVLTATLQRLNSDAPN